MSELDQNLRELCLYAFWHESLGDETLSSYLRIEAVFKMLADNGVSMESKEQPNMKFAVGDFIGKRTASVGSSLPNKKGVVMGYKKTIRKDGKPQWRYVVKMQNGKIEEWIPGMVYLCEDKAAERVAFT